MFLLTVMESLKSGMFVWLNKKCNSTVASPLLTVLFSTRAAALCTLLVKTVASKYSMSRPKRKKENLREDMMTLYSTCAGTTLPMATSSPQVQIVLGDSGNEYIIIHYFIVFDMAVTFFATLLYISPSALSIAFLGSLPINLFFGSCVNEPAISSASF